MKKSTELPTRYTWRSCSGSLYYEAPSTQFLSRCECQEEFWRNIGDFMWLFFLVTELLSLVNTSTSTHTFEHGTHKWTYCLQIQTQWLGSWFYSTVAPLWLKNLESKDKEVRKSIIVPTVFDTLPDDCMTFVLSVIKAK